MGQQTEQLITQAIRRVSSSLRISQILVGIAKEVSENTCIVEREGFPTLYDVRLNAVGISLGSHATIYPVEGSIVLVGLIEGMSTESVVLQCSEVRRIHIVIGSQNLVMDEKGIVINEGKNNGVPKVNELVKWMQKVQADLNTLAGLLKNIPITGATAVVTFLPTTPAPDSITLQNEKLKH